MSLRFTLNWEAAPEVRLAEHAATWARLSVEIGETFATLVEERDGSLGPRKYLDVPTYPLAELLAINWWRLNATSHVASDGGVKLVNAAEGFPWPDLTLRSDRGLIWAGLRQRDKSPEYVRFLTQGETVLSSDLVIDEIARFVDSTVRRLDDQGVVGTLLQDEWAAIQEADADERAFCMVAAAWGQDPYDMSPDVEAMLLRAGQAVGDPDLLSDLARAVPLSQLNQVESWLMEAVSALRVIDFALPQLGPIDWPSASGLPPWRVGYERARQLRQSLELPISRSAPVEDMVAVHAVSGASPTNVDALLRADTTSSGIVVSSHTAQQARRFAGARAIARRALHPRNGISLLTRGSQYGDRAERAFAAEFLAPADGLGALLDGDYSDDSLRSAATHFDVSLKLVEHQVENQIAA